MNQLVAFEDRGTMRLAQSEALVPTQLTRLLQRSASGPPTAARRQNRTEDPLGPGREYMVTPESDFVVCGWFEREQVDE